MAAIRGGNVCKMHGGSAPQVREAALQRLLMAADRCAGVLVEIATSRKAERHARVSAANSVLDRAGLAAKHMHEHSGPGGGPIAVQIEERLRAGRERVARMAAEAVSDHKPA